MASVAPWILLSFALMLCFTQAQRQSPCSCRPSEIRDLKRIPRNNILKCFIQERSQDCDPAFVITIKPQRLRCIKPTASWVINYISNGLSCPSLIV